MKERKNNKTDYEKKNMYIYIFNKKGQFTQNSQTSRFILVFR